MPFNHNEQVAVEFSRFVTERVQYLRRNNGMSDSVVRYMERKRRSFGKEIDGSPSTSTSSGRRSGSW